jgi:hypothetical protein
MLSTHSHVSFIVTTGYKKNGASSLGKCFGFPTEALNQENLQRANQALGVKYTHETVVDFDAIFDEFNIINLALQYELSSNEKDQTLSLSSRNTITLAAQTPQAVAQSSFWEFNQFLTASDKNFLMCGLIRAQLR